MTYTLINYFDVLGNPKDGFIVNNQCVECADLVIADDATDKDIVVYLRDHGYLTTADMRKLSVVSDGTNLEITLKNGMPLFGLMLNW